MPLAEPDVVLFRDGAIFQDLPDSDRALEDVEEIAGVFFPPGEVHDPLGFDTGQCHFPQPLPDLAVVLSAIRLSEDGDHRGRGEADGVGDDPFPAPEPLQNLLECEILVLIGSGR